MKRLLSQVLLALALLCGVIFVGGMIVACLSDNINVIRTGCIMSWSSAGLGLILAVFGTDLSK